MKELKKILNKLPEENWFLLKRLLEFLNLIRESEEFNKMSATNLAIVFAPNLLTPPADQTIRMMNDARAINHILTSLMENFDFFFDKEVSMYNRMPYPVFC